MYSEINELVRSSMEGSNDAREILIDRLNPLIVSSIRRYCPIEREFQDLVQDGAVIILQCLEEFSPSRGVNFLYYVKSSLKFYYLETFRYLKKNENMSLNSVNDEGDELLDMLVEDFSIEDFLVENFEREYLSWAVEKLPPRQREIVVLFYLRNLSLSEISKFLKISYRGVVNSKVKAIENLRRYLNDFGQKVNQV